MARSGEETVRACVRTPLLLLGAWWCRAAAAARCWGERRATRHVQPTAGRRHQCRCAPAATQTVASV